MSIVESTAFLHPGKTFNVLPFFIFSPMFISEACHVITVKACWLKFRDSSHLKSPLLSSYLFNKITFVLHSLLSITFESIDSSYIDISEIKKISA